ncbi:hypothetical protein C9374_011486 [Naegleria lovaniensis]|uniref:F-box domain-containing protein n=1 Tax=Naegleria lovaniensis TaxID=51637 RepID=A0AA88H2L2_NAELO|nr:uncharacterized protein C9374_011486 [Naegleria lovaniensis]KAG2392761.1 hypothetical protein C9374_011486 [Naegleria lovaniensis]
MFQNIPIEVIQFDICSYLDTRSIVSLSQCHSHLYDEISNSDVVWQTLLFQQFKNIECPLWLKDLHPYTSSDRQHSSMNTLSKSILSSAVKCFEQLATTIYRKKKVQQDWTDHSVWDNMDDWEDLEINRTILDYELRGILYAYKNQFIFHCFRLFSFDSTFERATSCLGFTLSNHLLKPCHTQLTHGWETCVCKKELRRGYRYFWCVHLTLYEDDPSAHDWKVLIGVDNMPNGPRSSTSPHSTCFGQQFPSIGFGYNVGSDCEHPCFQRGTRPLNKNANKQGDLIGVEFYFPKSGNDLRDRPELTCYIQNGKQVRHMYGNNRPNIAETYRPVISLISRQYAVSVFPWDGDVEKLMSISMN